MLTPGFRGKVWGGENPCSEERRIRLCGAGRAWRGGHVENLHTLLSMFPALETAVNAVLKGDI